MKFRVVDWYERDIILSCYKECCYDKVTTAEKLGITVRTLRRKLEFYESITEQDIEEFSSYTKEALRAMELT